MVCDWSAVGEGSGRAQNPPEMSDADLDAWNFYTGNATVFVRDFGLMPELLRGKGHEGAEKELFMNKLAVIHDGVLEATRSNGRRDSDPDLLEGDL